MENERLYDIQQVCELLGVTSRTLRFYEEKGIIQSTPTFPSPRRHYTEKQIAHIKTVLILRAIGLPLRTIAALQNEGIDLKTAILQRRAELSAALHARVCEMRLLNEALVSLEAGNDISAKSPPPPAQEKLYAIVQDCVRAILNANEEELFHHFTPKLVEYMPKDVYIAVRHDTFLPLGEFVRIDEIRGDESDQSRFFCRARFSKMGLKITLHFCGEKIDGLWFHYYLLDKNISL